ncbi:tetratricopeptide repeat protein [Bdellovibrio bacteriovorus]|uniref:tetratricopeptide repeat protein n=1 Tax=Bdellovibrio TaxID=958 RepID=UPI0035A99B28
MKLVLLRAALGVALLFSGPSLFAQTKNGKSETYKDIIEKAYNLSLQRDRQQALNILSSAIQRETRPQAVAELKKTVSEVSNIFFSDKAQQLFETGVSLRKTDLNQALDKVTEASRIEPDNFSIVSEMARLMIAKGDCKAAQETVQKQLAIVSFDEDLKLSLAQALACQGKWVEYQKIADSVVIKRSPQQKFWWALEMDKFIGAKNLTKAQEALGSLKKSDEKYPESFYWIWKFDQAQKRTNLDEAQKYVMTCKNISANQYRQYMIDPMLCRRLTEVESELKGMNGTSE